MAQTVPANGLLYYEVTINRVTLFPNDPRKVNIAKLEIAGNPTQSFEFEWAPGANVNGSVVGGRFDSEKLWPTLPGSVARTDGANGKIFMEKAFLLANWSNDLTRVVNSLQIKWPDSGGE